MNQQQILENIIEINSCWLWKGKRSKNYGPFKESYRIFKGEIPKGLYLDHLCHVKSCVNPEHLEPVTNTENMRRKRHDPRPIFLKKKIRKLTFDLDESEAKKVYDMAARQDRSVSSLIRNIIREHLKK